MGRMILVSQYRETAKYMASRYKLSGLVDMPNIRPEVVKPDDVIYVAKALPWPVMAELCARTNRVEFLITKVPRGLRGKDLSAKQLKELKAHYAPMHVTTHDLPVTEDVILVTRHSGAQTWLRQFYPNAPLVEHWDEADWPRVGPQTSLIGVLPPELVRKLNKRGGRFFALQYEERLPYGAELKLEDMEAYGPHLQGYTVAEGYMYACSNCETAFMLPHGWLCSSCGGYGDYLCEYIDKD
jgi:putative CRISPR-associated protein (TIGR02620 family)